MRTRSLTLSVGLLIVAVLLPAGTGAAVEVIKDGGFESTPAGQNNPNWDEGGVAPPICDVEFCGDDSGTAGPRNGKNWAWLGGVPNPDLQSVAQQVVIPSPLATLTFWLWLGRANGGAPDAFRVFIGNTELLEILESASGFAAYTQVSVDMSPYADGVARTLSFEYEGFGGVQNTNFSVDDISLQAGPLSPKSVTLKGPKAVDQGKKAKLKATVSPCPGHEGDTVDLYRGKKKIATVASDASCTAKFKAKVKKTSKFTAVSPQQDADHAAGTSKKLKVRAKS